MRSGYKANYSDQVRQILKDPAKSTALVKAIEQIRSNPDERSAQSDGIRVHTDPPKKAAVAAG